MNYNTSAASAMNTRPANPFLVILTARGTSQPPPLKRVACIELSPQSHSLLHKWLLGFRLMASSKKGFSAHQFHRSLVITYQSAWFMAHRIREAMRALLLSPPFPSLGIVEAVETFLFSSSLRLYLNSPLLSLLFLLLSLSFSSLFSLLLYFLLLSFFSSLLPLTLLSYPQLEHLLSLSLFFYLLTPLYY